MEQWLFADRKDGKLEKELEKVTCIRYATAMTLEEAVQTYNIAFNTELLSPLDYWYGESLGDRVEFIGDLAMYGIGERPDKQKFFIAKGNTMSAMKAGLLSGYKVERRVCKWRFKDTIQAYNEIPPFKNHPTNFEYWMTPLVEWYGFDKPEKNVCDCGAEKARTTHADWCSTKVRA